MPTAYIIGSYLFNILQSGVVYFAGADLDHLGLDIHEHGLTSAYSGFSISDPTYAEMSVNENTDLGEDDITVASEAKINAAVKVVKEEPWWRCR